MSLRYCNESVLWCSPSYSTAQSARADVTVGDERDGVAL